MFGMNITSFFSNHVLDIGIIIFIVLAGIVGFRKGFLASLIGLLGSLIALILALLASEPLAKLAADTMGIKMEENLSPVTEGLPVMAEGIFLQIICFFFAFIILKLIIALIASFLPGRDTLIGKIDGIFGLVFGVISALLIIFITIDLLSTIGGLNIFPGSGKENIIVNMIKNSSFSYIFSDNQFITEAIKIFH